MATIMVVEDNEPSRDALARRLERRGYNVLLAVDGYEAVILAREGAPDLILMDLGVPGLDGWEATRRIKAHTVTQHIPIIVLSADAMTRDRDVAPAVSDDVGAQPVRFDLLLEKIESLLTKDVVS